MFNLRGRVIWVAVIFAVGFTAVSSRLVFVQLVRHDYYREKAIKMHYVGIPVPARRGRIMDRNHSILAQTITVTDLRIDGKLAWENPEVFAQIAPFIDMTPAELRSVVDRKNRYRLIHRNLSDDQVVRLQALNIRPLIFKERESRVYPNGSEASHLVGFVNAKEKEVPLTGEKVGYEVGMDGVERVMDRYLRGIAGVRRVVRDASKREIAAFRQSDIPPRDGYDVVLTIDQGIQHIIENEANLILEKHQPKALHIMVVRPQTGEILAATSRPTFDPNNRGTMKTENLRSAFLLSMYEPGSTFKLVTLAAALNEGVADLEMPVFCENGKFFYAGKWLNDHNPYGMLPLVDVVAKSSNIGFAKLAILLGPEKIYEYAKRFGFGGILPNSSPQLPGGSKGMLHPLNRWTPLSVTRVPMGYEVAVTNLQMAMAYSAIANDGKLMEPRLVKAVANDEGKVVAQFLPKAVRHVVKPEIAHEIRKALRHVVSEEGTARLATVRGWTVGGKTGTAQKLIDGEYDHKNYTASFIGFLPAENPEFVVSIVVDRPSNGKIYGGLVAGPAFSSIASQVAQHLNLVRPGTQTAQLDRGTL